ncbi:MAG TPA: glutathione peroxidase [Acidothermaceae bacterium]
MSDLLDLPVTTLQGTHTTFGELTAGRVALVVNVASRCGNTPQYAKLEELQQTLADRDFTVLGFPCNQFKGQEPGTAADIAEFCSATYGVTFPMSDKIEVNGAARDPIYAVLTQTPYAKAPSLPAPRGDGDPANVDWNFEKFVVAPDGKVLGRFTPKTQPDDPAVLACIDSALDNSALDDTALS